MSADEAYLALVRDVLARGFERADRTGVGTRALFGAHLRFSLADGAVPLLTTKEVFWRGVVEELLWFLRGETDVRKLSARGIKFWDANATRAFLDTRKLFSNREGDIGPAYGFQWRHFGADYAGADADYAGKGVDQVSGALDALRADPNSRRIVISAWNPAQLDRMALPPCHLLAQFLAQDGRLTCVMYQRSADIGLGLPFNMASYALLTHMLAHAAGMRAHELVINIGDAHIYRTHIEALKEQLLRAPRAEVPRVRLAAPPTKPLEEYALADIQLVDYRPHAAIPMPMAV